MTAPHPLNPALSAAAAVKGMADGTTNKKLAFVFTGLSVGLVGIMLVRELSHCVQESLRSHDRHHGRHDRHR